MGNMQSREELVASIVAELRAGESIDVIDLDPLLKEHPVEVVTEVGMRLSEAGQEALLHETRPHRTRGEQRFTHRFVRKGESVLRSGNPLVGLQLAPHLELILAGNATQKHSDLALVRAYVEGLPPGDAPVLGATNAIAAALRTRPTDTSVHHVGQVLEQLRTEGYLDRVGAQRNEYVWSVSPHAPRFVPPLRGIDPEARELYQRSQREPGLLRMADRVGEWAEENGIPFGRVHVVSRGLAYLHRSNMAFSGGNPNPPPVLDEQFEAEVVKLVRPPKVARPAASSLAPLVEALGGIEAMALQAKPGVEKFQLIAAAVVAAAQDGTLPEGQIIGGPTKMGEARAVWLARTEARTDAVALEPDDYTLALVQLRRDRVVVNPKTGDRRVRVAAQNAITAEQYLAGPMTPPRRGRSPKSTP